MYAYNASAVALGGVINGPTRNVLSSVASSVLSPTGGDGTNIVTNFNHGGIAFDRAETRVWGFNADPLQFNTRSEVWITNLRLRNELQIASMSASIVSTRSRDSVDSKWPDASFRIHAEYLDVRVRKQTVAIRLDLDFFNDRPTYEDLLTSYGNDIDLWEQKFNSRNKPWDGAIIQSSLLAQNLDCREPGVRADRNKLTIPGFGDVHFGEVLLKHGLRRLSLLRVELNGGSVHNQQLTSQFSTFADAGGGADTTDTSTLTTFQSGGSYAMGAIESNGTPIYPP